MDYFIRSCAFSVAYYCIRFMLFFFIACPKGCRNKICDIATGKCVSCNDGFFGDNCTESKYILFPQNPPVFTGIYMK